MPLPQHHASSPSPAPTNTCVILTNSDNLYSENPILVVPNPVNFNAIINISEENLPIIANLYNSTGQILQKIPISQTKTNLETIILPNGVYFLSFLDKNKQQKTAKIVVLHE